MTHSHTVQYTPCPEKKAPKEKNYNMHSIYHNSITLTQHYLTLI